MRAFAIGFLLLTAGPSFAAETYVGSDADAQRTMLGFKVPDAAIRKVLPQGWEPDVATSGPDRDINLHLTFIDRLTAQNAEGKTLDPLRLITVTIPAKKTGSETRGSMAFRLYSASASGVPGVYGVAVRASTTTERKVRIDPAGTATVEESWDIRSDDGDIIQLQIQYVRGVLTPGKEEGRFYSLVRPDFYRIYRSEVLMDVVRGPATDRIQKIIFKASGPKLAPFFEGSEQLIGVTSVPWYTRRTYLGGS
jgi:hypothetical protein